MAYTLRPGQQLTYPAQLTNGKARIYIMSASDGANVVREGHHGPLSSMFKNMHLKKGRKPNCIKNQAPPKGSTANVLLIAYDDQGESYADAIEGPSPRAIFALCDNGEVCWLPPTVIAEGDQDFPPAL